MFFIAFTVQLLWFNSFCHHCTASDISTATFIATHSPDLGDFSFRGRVRQTGRHCNVETCSVLAGYRILKQLKSPLLTAAQIAQRSWRAGRRRYVRGWRGWGHWRELRLCNALTSQREYCQEESSDMLCIRMHPFEVADQASMTRSRLHYACSPECCQRASVCMYWHRL